MSNESDVDVYQSSGEEWNEETEKKRTPTRRTSQRLRKKPRISIDIETTDSEEDEIDIPQPRKKPSKQSPKQLITKRVPYQIGTQILNKDFSTGGFVVLKKDVQRGDTSKPPCLWRIDGKALLQKYEPIEEDGKTMHRSTSIYTGWTPLDKDQYSPVNVKVQWHTSQQMTVELNWETLKNATLDSD